MSSRCKMPDIMKTDEGKERRVGVEIELSGLGYEDLVSLCSKLLGGQARPVARYVCEIDTDIGAFGIELDSDPIKDLNLNDQRLPESVRGIGGQAMNVIDAAAEKIVPLEIVSPPLPFSELERIETLCDELHKAGALGSREALYFAFGLQLNPELPDLRPSTLVRYLQAFATLYEWLKARHQIDFSRKLTTYVEPWNSTYVDLMISEDYAPGMDQLIKDYLHFNPTRNKALDLLPLFAHLNSGLLGRYVNDERIKSRPTLHYRLPDCDIDNPLWHFSTVWNDWVVLEQLASNATDLSALVSRFRDSRKLSFHNLTHSWVDTCDQWLRSRNYV
ncbi:amidoligase family protein [Marinobacter sp. TBZ242]|uniref:Amidoligase family protein n=1 Tax=Marinobacter azerbaijanicus TaxID=3050455 RepID=A0ABT7I8H2_9GAMM|nr:amidoligase family protein [Marinobacter sp. TBZ242]MDL0430092.1 amidoligase family protein [Marinobacter sp. TBZ242]